MSTIASPAGPALTISFDRQTAVIHQVGARLFSYTVDDKPVVGGPELPEGVGDVYKGGRGQLLMPWPNRVKDGAYDFAGASLQLPINEVARGHASHGFVRTFCWNVIEHRDSSLTLGCDLPSQIGFPFPFATTVTYELDDNGLKVTIDARNSGDSPMPFGVGAHPYFAAGSTSIEDTILTAPAEHYFDVDDVMIPVGDALSVTGTAYDLRNGVKLSELDLDTPFTNLERDHNGIAHVTLAASIHMTRLWMDANFDHLMIYTGGGHTPDRPRSFVALEPMSCAPDAFNNGRGLRILEPGASFHGVWGVTFA